MQTFSLLKRYQLSLANFTVDEGFEDILEGICAGICFLIRILYPYLFFPRPLACF